MNNKIYNELINNIKILDNLINEEIDKNKSFDIDFIKYLLKNSKLTKGE